MGWSSSKFWQCFEDLPATIQKQAKDSYKLLKSNPAPPPPSPSLQFKSIKNGKFNSVRVSLNYRALGVSVPAGVQWFWIGSHACCSLNLIASNSPYTVIC
jgi:hypothetical protein